MRGDRGTCHFVRNSMMELLIYFIRRKNWTRSFSIYSESWLNVQYISGPIFPRVGNLVRDYFSCGKIYAITPVWKSIQQHWIEMSVLGYMRGSRKLLPNPPPFRSTHAWVLSLCLTGMIQHLIPKEHYSQTSTYRGKDKLTLIFFLRPVNTTK